MRQFSIIFLFLDGIPCYGLSWRRFGTAAAFVPACPHQRSYDLDLCAADL
jgi:hypothetical protein